MENRGEEAERQERKRRANRRRKERHHVSVVALKMMFVRRALGRACSVTTDNGCKFLTLHRRSDLLGTVCFQPVAGFCVPAAVKDQVPSRERQNYITTPFGKTTGKRQFARAV